MADPGFPVEEVWTHWGGVDLQHGCFLAKMYAKMKKFGLMGGHVPSTPPRSANAKAVKLLIQKNHKMVHLVC